MADIHANVRGYRTKGGAVITVERVRPGTQNMVDRVRRYRVTGRRFVRIRLWLAGATARYICGASLMRSSFNARLRGARK